MRTAARVGLCTAALVGALATGGAARAVEARAGFDPQPANPRSATLEPAGSVPTGSVPTTSVSATQPVSATASAVASAPAPSTSPVTQLDPGFDIEAERRTFATSLQAYRAGNDAALAPLAASAERMASARRADALDVVAFYRQLTPDERRAGFAAEARFDSLRDAVVASADLDSQSWPARRASIQAGLEALIAEQRDAQDPTPAARALALAARLDEQRARYDTALGPADVAALLVRVESGARDAIALFAKAGLVTPTLEPVWLLARVEDARGNVGAARRGFEDCQDLAERVASEDFLVRALRGLILVADGVGDREEQRGLLRELAAVREPKDDWWLARQWGALLIAEDEAEEARRFLAQNEPALAVEASEWHFLYGSALQRLGRLEEAESHFEKVVLAPSAHVKIEGTDVETLISRAQSALERGDAAGALALAESLTDAGCSAPARAQRAYTIGAAHLALGDAARAETSLRSALEQGRALEARLARSDDGAVFGEVVGLETIALLADALMRQGRALEAVRVSEEIQTRALRSQSDIAITEDDVRAWVATFERGLLTWIVGADTTVCAYVAPDGSAHAIAIPLGREILHDAVRRAREAAIAGDEPRARQLAAEIEARVVPEDLRRRIPSAGRLLVLAHGPLERMPFDLTGLAHDGPLAVLPGLASARPGVPPTASELAAWSILGDPSSVEGESVLPGARAEVETIARLVHAAPKTGDAFDRLEILDALRCGRSLHIATHLVRGVGEGGRDAGLLLAGGALLTAREIREVAPRLPMAVLAACETANGRYVDAQALSSVSNAFLASGTRNLCVTLWPVEDGAARRWSESFHRALAAGARPSLAARHAQDELKRHGTPVSEWAAFRFVGRD